MVLGHLPYAPYFDPGPAYNNFGPQPILSTGAIGGPIVAGSPVYAATTTCGYECDVFAFDRNIKSPYMENYNLNIQQQISSKAVAPGRIRRIARPSALALLRSRASPARRRSMPPT